jgi:phenylpropionate dioxygenase-like ring-hydroxylating dioxygenase large terminal subunit
MDFRDFWYIAAASRELKKDAVVGARVLGQSIAIFRDETGEAAAVEDRCLHRSARLSSGQVRQGLLQCSYHGWTYNSKGQVVYVPSEGPDSQNKSRHCARTYQVSEVDDYVYVKLADQADEQLKPFRIPFYRAEGWGAIRLKNRFSNNVTNCAENFVDVPHTAFVHSKIFRVSKNEKFTAQVERRSGSVTISYQDERKNLGIFSRFLNPGGHLIKHTDSFHMPNVTCVDYDFGRNRRFIITSQSIPVTDEETIVYTDLTYNYGVWNTIARPIIRWQAQTIIDQDIKILANQMKAIKEHGSRFSNTEADLVHILIESIRNEIERGADPRLLPDMNREIKFWV